MAETLDIKYIFELKDGSKKSFDISLDKKTLSLISDDIDPKPDWTKLSFYQCPNCPLDEAVSPHCPVALALFKPVATFKDFISHDEVDVYIETPTRKYMKHTPLHIGLSSLAGIFMVTCGCPVLEKLKPMVRYHLPFADEDETSYRAMSMYLMAQFLVKKKGGEPDWEMKGLAKIYDEIMIVNKHFVQRLQNTPIKDASLNAVITLDCFAMTVCFSLTDDLMDELRDLFKVYLS